MANTETKPPRWIVVRLGDDLNWWVDETSDERPAHRYCRGALDPRQVAYLTEQFDAYRPHGLRRDQLTAAFHVYELEAEVSDGVLRLALSAQDLFEAGAAELFALPVATGEDGPDAYTDLLDALCAAHLRQLNATHHYARACTQDEMMEEFATLDNDRYFGGETRHAFDEFNEILEWNPTDWG
jgi:hypothetical protein